MHVIVTVQFPGRNVSIEATGTRMICQGPQISVRLTVLAISMTALIKNKTEC